MLELAGKWFNWYNILHQNDFDSKCLTSFNSIDRWEGFKIKINAPNSTILLGAKGSTSAGTINTLVAESLANDYLGVMVWYASVVDGLQYGGGSWDASTAPATQEAYINGMKRFKNELWFFVLSALWVSNLTSFI